MAAGVVSVTGAVAVASKRTHFNYQTKSKQDICEIPVWPEIVDPVGGVPVGETLAAIQSIIHLLL